MLREKSRRKQADRASELIDHVDEWADEGTVDPAVADHLIELLEPIAGDGPAATATARATDDPEPNPTELSASDVVALHLKQTERGVRGGR